MKSRGFTLVELMISTAIVGILASVAIPGYGEVIHKLKAIEQTTLRAEIKKASKLRIDSPMLFSIPYYGMPGYAFATQWSGNWATMGAKENFVVNDPGWNDLNFSYEGQLRGRYYFFLTNLGGSPNLSFYSVHDLNQDGQYCYWIEQYYMVNNDWVLSTDYTYTCPDATDHLSPT